MTFLGSQFNQKTGVSAKQDRILTGALAQGLGVVSFGDLLASASTGFTSLVAAGRAFIAPTTAAASKGIYSVYNDSAVSLTHANPDATNPRIDAIFVRVLDSTDLGDPTGSDGVSARIATGTPTSGATLTNLTGAGVPESNSILVAYVLVPAAAASAASFTYLDRRYTPAGAAIFVPSSDSRTNTAYGLMANQDLVRVYLPARGVLEVLYQATWQESVNAAARAAIFIGANQLKMASAGGSIASEIGLGAVSLDSPLASYSLGLTSVAGIGGAADVTTGQVFGQSGGAPSGGICSVFADPGFYDVSVQFKASSGNVVAKNRRLYVKVKPYGGAWS